MAVSKAKEFLEIRISLFAIGKGSCPQHFNSCYCDCTRGPIRECRGPLQSGIFQAPHWGLNPQQTWNIPQTTDPNGSQFGLHPQSFCYTPKLKILEKACLQCNGCMAMGISAHEKNIEMKIFKTK
jgi:hypothetical protein